MSTAFAHVMSWLTKRIHELDSIPADFQVRAIMVKYGIIPQLVHKTQFIPLSKTKVKKLMGKLIQFIKTNSKCPNPCLNRWLYSPAKEGGLGLFDLMEERDQSLMREIRKLELGIGHPSTVSLFRDLPCPIPEPQNTWQWVYRRLHEMHKTHGMCSAILDVPENRKELISPALVGDEAKMNKHFKQGWTLCDLEVNTDPEDNDDGSTLTRQVPSQTFFQWRLIIGEGLTPRLDQEWNDMFDYFPVMKKALDEKGKSSGNLTGLRRVLQTAYQDDSYEIYYTDGSWFPEDDVAGSAVLEARTGRLWVSRVAGFQRCGRAELQAALGALELSWVNSPNHRVRS